MVKASVKNVCSSRERNTNQFSEKKLLIIAVNAGPLNVNFFMVCSVVVAVKQPMSGLLATYGYQFDLKGNFRKVPTTASSNCFHSTEAKFSRHSSAKHPHLQRDDKFLLCSYASQCVYF